MCGNRADRHAGLIADKRRSLEGRWNQYNPPIWACAKPPHRGAALLQNINFPASAR
jgi:hypothetical protein